MFCQLDLRSQNHRVVRTDSLRQMIGSRAVHSTDRDSQTLQRPETSIGEGDSDAVAHIVIKDEQMRGYVGGEPIKALCGKVWVPSRDYQGLPVCQACVDERDRRLAGMKRMN